MRGRTQLEAASGTMPRWENTKPNRAASLAMRISIASCMVTPMPTAGPFTAAITGFKHLKMPRGAGPAPGSRPGEDDGADFVILVRLVRGVDKPPVHGGIEGVELVRPVQRDGE